MAKVQTTTVTPIMTDGNGEIPSTHPNCGGFLDFHDKDTMECRECGALLNIDKLVSEYGVQIQ